MQLGLLVVGYGSTPDRRRAGPFCGSMRAFVRPSVEGALEERWRARLIVELTIGAAAVYIVKRLKVTGSGYEIVEHLWSRSHNNTCQRFGTADLNWAFKIHP